MHLLLRHPRLAEPPVIALSALSFGPLTALSADPACFPTAGRAARPSPANQWSTLTLIGTLVAALAILYLAREVFIPFAFALALTLILTPITTWLQRPPSGPSSFGRDRDDVAVVAAGRYRELDGRRTN